MPKLVPMGLFATPEDMDALMANIEVFTARGERQAATVAMGVTWNFCAEATKNMIEKRAAAIAITFTTKVRMCMQARNPAQFLPSSSWFVDVVELAYKEIEAESEKISNFLASVNAAAMVTQVLIEDPHLDAPRTVESLKNLYQITQKLN